MTCEALSHFELPSRLLEEPSTPTGTCGPLAPAFEHCDAFNGHRSSLECTPTAAGLLIGASVALSIALGTKLHKRAGGGGEVLSNRQPRLGTK